MGPENRRYMTGFTGSSGAALISFDHAMLLTDFRYVEQAACEAPAYRVVKHGIRMADALKEAVRETGARHLGFEPDVLTCKDHETFRAALEGAELVPAEGVVERLRMVKDEAEVQRIRRAESIGDAAFSHILDLIKPGMTENEVALELEWFMRKNGAEKAGFDVVVASGPRGAMPHARATHKPLARGELVVLDFGAVVDGYRGDMTRTVSLGRAGPEERAMYGLVLRAQKAALEGMSAGRTGDEVDAMARRVIDEAGHGERFGHGLGHGVGLAVHEEPRLRPSSSTALAPGMVVTVEPGVYLPGRFGVRIEDLVVVESGGVRNLTASPKELIEL